MYIAYFLNNDDKREWLNIVKNRLTEQMNFAFNDEMVHVENSPGYQMGVIDLFRIISEFLVQFNDEYGTKLYDDVIKSTEFMAYIAKPNGAVAAIGDTNDIIGGNIIKNMEHFKNDHLTYGFSQGTRGTKPTETSMFYPKSGYYISHNRWESEDYSKSTWTMFKSGYSSKTHKHADDNSFMLYSKGYDIFVDSGWYNYTTGNKYRDYYMHGT
ncbi:MAG: heparinase II/III family protein [Methanobacteriaceae archaeon]|nr:heparinase II/III family protein [Methanobacteriaceae archaeon]